MGTIFTLSEIEEVSFDISFSLSYIRIKLFSQIHMADGKENESITVRADRMKLVTVKNEKFPLPVFVAQ